MFTCILQYFNLFSHSAGRSTLLQKACDYDLPDFVEVSHAFSSLVLYMVTLLDTNTQL
jgi:hypothetical protein